MVLHPDGSVTFLVSDDIDLLLGIDPYSLCTQNVTALESGATVLRYTDGLVERRGHSPDDGLQRLRDTLVAVVAVRLHRQDQPRPTQAGPRRLPNKCPTSTPARSTSGG